MNQIPLAEIPGERCRSLLRRPLIESGQPRITDLEAQSSLA